MPTLRFSEEAVKQLRRLERDKGQAKRLKAVRAALGRMEINLRHPGLKTHSLQSQPCPHGGKLFEAYAQNNTPGAFRIFWCYDPDVKDQLWIIAITEHP